MKKLLKKINIKLTLSLGCFKQIISQYLWGIKMGARTIQLIPLVFALFLKVRQVELFKESRTQK
jgi:hypothetical protein